MATELPIVCSLDSGELAGRADAWRDLADSALIGAERTATTAVQRYRRQPEVEAKLRELIALEAECCPFLDFELDAAADELVLSVGGPADAAAVIDLFAPQTAR